ncbi:MAG: hypothetical protein ACF8MF_02365 [Phycisphaerales bacterium JB052]
MKTWVILIAGVVLIITPQIIVGVVAANTAWVQSSYLYAIAQSESHGEVASEMVRAHPLPSMPDWMMITSTGSGLILCVLSIAFGMKKTRNPNDS